MVKQCTTCAKQAKQKKEPLMPTDLPDYPWQVVGADFFEIKGSHYLITVDYFSCYPEVTKLTSTTSSSVITALKAIFSRHELPEVVRSDNGPQFSSHDFSRFANTYNFNHVTSSPFYPQSNGQAERTVQTVKGIIQKSTDPFMALLSYRSTPMPWCGLNPAELCIGRLIKSSVPQIKNLLAPTWAYIPEFSKKNSDFKEKQKRNYDWRHRVRDLPEIPDDMGVWIQSETEALQGRISTSYVVEIPAGDLRRNRNHLSIIPSSHEMENHLISQPGK